MDEITERQLPQTLREAVIYFSDPDACVSFVAGLRWPEGPVCPRCGGKEHSYVTTRRLWRCKSCKREFTVKLGTIFEDSPLPLEKWLPAVWLIANSKNGISSYELGRALGVSQKSAWFMLHRIRLAMQAGSFERASGHVEVDETFIGGKARNMHIRRRRERITGTGGKDKIAVVGVLTRGGRIQTQIIPDRRRPTLQALVRQHVLPGSNIYTDALGSYRGLDGDYTHAVVDHAREYVDGAVHTNGVENFWALLKRGLKGTYISVEPFHLFRYLDERAFTFNERDRRDLGRFLLVLAQAVGRRVTWAELTGKAHQAKGAAAI
ncbi:MAG TPA: IS1595 family transposase [Candidatus Limnocylindrales bacterium]|nr:IS1595 family transposase [Candidatus Limnocylindrales bacterium]